MAPSALSLALAALPAALAVVAPRKLPLHVSLAGNGGNSTPVAAEDLDYTNWGCCAGFGNGNYLANISISGPQLVDLGLSGDIDSVHGFVGANANTEQFIVSLGSMDPRASTAGFYGTTCSKTGRPFGVAWKKDKCKCFELSNGVPSVCFGKGTYFPRFREKVHLDLFTHLLKYQNYEANKVVALNTFTCMPFWKWVDMTNIKDTDEDSWLTGLLDDAAALRGADDNRPKPVEHNRLFILYQNATATAPNHDMFGVPPVCRKAMEDFAAC